MNETLEFQPEAFATELDMEEYPSTFFETEELEAALEEESRRGGGFRSSGNRLRPQSKRFRAGGPRGPLRPRGSLRRQGPSRRPGSFRQQASLLGRGPFRRQGLPRPPGLPRGPSRLLQRRGLNGPLLRRPRPQRNPRGPFFRGRRFLFNGLSGPALGAGVSDGGERSRWVQDCLNQVMQTNLPVTGVMDAATRSAVRSFQQRENLRPTGIVGPDTEEALKRACGGGAEASSQDSGAAAASAAAAPTEAAPSESTEQEWSVEAEEEGFLGDLADRALDAFGGASGSRIIDLTAQADKSLRKGTRDAKKVYALVLHQMACCFKPKEPLKRFLTLNSHFAILADGRILQLHPITSLLWASNGFNAGSVAVEFAGNFPDTQGKWWKGETFGKNRPTPEQLEAGRYLVRYLIKTMGLTHVLAHRQSSGSRTNDPGPEVWYNVGQWAVDKLGMKDGGATFKVSTGRAIPTEWRSWGRTGAAHEMEEAEQETAAFESETEELEHQSEEVEHESGCGCKKCRGSGSGGRWVRNGRQITLQV